ncbi:MAG TPA: hypothetical protein VGC24_01475, partial [Burkholderiaceae bacterium]
REALRESRDRDGMLLVAEEMMDEVARIAGRERSDSIRDRIALLLPHETGTTAHAELPAVSAHPAARAM